MTIFEYLQDKDVFQKFYNKHLARRLIHSTSVAEDAEAHMISCLKIACGSDYTASMQKMMQDMTISRDLNAAFQKDRVRTGQVQNTGKPAPSPDIRAGAS